MRVTQSQHIHSNGIEMNSRLLICLGANTRVCSNVKYISINKLSEFYLNQEVFFPFVNRIITSVNAF